MLSDAKVATRLPAQDLERARRFYSEKLGLEPVEDRPAGGVGEVQVGEGGEDAAAGGFGGAAFAE